MAKIIYITGGQRSGKSSYAQQLALSLSENPVYLATSRHWDDNYSERIKRHQDDRGPEWTNIEEEKFISNHDLSGKVVVMDCVTLWLTNFFFDLEQDIEKVLTAAKSELEKVSKQDCTLIIISNEIGMGGHPTHPTQMKFTDLQGWMNQYIGKKSDEAFLMVSGLPMKLK
ncbi:bifunctional adenosylcobinamide kinase/adenosylcobinamide-phosphate guanylyltransferase [Limibacter armeniacum]|uniref:bifunctional adenosylcobinamide kinase/adenosylcobinamide-phosphate guanylyltransferase n=1 Tax=Limibacter armeniacum TaxID=466084 RepID=UPI002FE60F89